MRAVPSTSPLGQAAGEDETQGFGRHLETTARHGLAAGDFLLPDVHHPGVALLVDVCEFLGHR